MKKPIIVGAALVLIAGVVFALRQGPSQTNNPFSLKKEIQVGQDVCGEFPKEWVQSVTGKSIMRTKRFDITGTHVCDYFFNENSFVSIHVEDLSVETQKKGNIEMDRTIKQDPRIPMDHFITWQKDNQINDIYLVLNPNRFMTVTRGYIGSLTNEENIQLAIRVVERIQKGENQGLVSAPTVEPTIKPTTAIAPLPQETDIVHTFFNLVEERKISDAVMMMTSDITNDDSTKQAWGVQLYAMKSVKVLDVAPSMPEEWKDNEHTYKVTLDVTMDPSSANQPIPYYGYENGKNIRWITLQKSGDLWKVMGISTGP